MIQEMTSSLESAALRHNRSHAAPFQRVMAHRQK